MYMFTTLRNAKEKAKAKEAQKKSKVCEHSQCCKAAGFYAFISFFTASTEGTDPQDEGS